MSDQEHWSSPNGCHEDCPACAEAVESAKRQKAHCKMCGAKSYVDKANGEHYGYCTPCIIGVFGQTKNHTLLFAAPDLLSACNRFIQFGKAGGDTGWQSKDAQDFFYQMMRAVGKATGATK